MDNQIKQVNTQKDTTKTEIDNITTSIDVTKTEIEKTNNQIASIKNEIEKIKNIINNLQNEIKLLEDKKFRLDYTQLVKEPTPSLNPVSPRIMVNIIIAGILCTIFLNMLSFLLEYIEKQKHKTNIKT